MDERRLWFMVIGAAWVVAFTLSLVVSLPTDVDRKGFSPDMPAFLGWQGIAALLAFALWAVGRVWPQGSNVRRLSAAPLWLAVLLSGALLAFYALPQMN